VTMLCVQFRAFFCHERMARGAAMPTQHYGRKAGGEKGCAWKSRRACHPGDIFRRGKMYRLYRRTQRRESMLLNGRMPGA
jgi:hypothetical protein